MEQPPPIPANKPSYIYDVQDPRAAAIIRPNKQLLRELQRGAELTFEVSQFYTDERKVGGGL